MTEAYAIKPCPFCGTPGKWFKTGRDVGIECGDESNCPGNAQTDTYDPEHKELAVNAWNKRVAVSEKGEADELPVDYFHSASEILRRIDAYLSRKEQCVVNPVMSCVCNRGTKSCIVSHPKEPK